MHARLGRSVGIGLGVLLATAIVAFLLSGKLQGLISRPILSLSETARIVSEKKDYSLRAEKQSNDEVGTASHPKLPPLPSRTSRRPATRFRRPA